MNKKNLFTLLLLLLLSVNTYAQKWEYRSPSKSPLTITLGPHMTLSHIPMRYAKGTNHDLGFDASFTYKNLYGSYYHSFTESHFTFYGGALGHTFTFANDRNGMIVSPNFGFGWCEFEIPMIADYYHHTYYTIGLGTDVRFYMGRLVMGFNYRYSVVTEDFSANIHMLSFNFGLRF